MKNKLKKTIIFITFICLLTTFCLHLYTIKKDRNDAPVSIISNQEKIAYLTFDDGPSPNTEKILKILDKYNIKATFFVVGPSYKLKNDLLVKIVQSGHELAIHSYEHNYSYIYSSQENYIKDFFRCLKWIKDVTGIAPNIYRFPGGSSNTIAPKQLTKSIIKELESQGFTHADWNVDTLDSYIKKDSSKILNNALISLKRNENNNHYYQTILMHDDINKPTSIKALPSIIESFISRGYHFEIMSNNSHIIKHIK